MFQKVFVDFWVDFYSKIPVTVTVSEYEEGFDAKWPHFTYFDFSWVAVFEMIDAPENLMPTVLI